GFVFRGTWRIVTLKPARAENSRRTSVPPWRRSSALTFAPLERRSRISTTRLAPCPRTWTDAWAASPAVLAEGASASVDVVSVAPVVVPVVVPPVDVPVVVVGSVGTVTVGSGTEGTGGSDVVTQPTGGGRQSCGAAGTAVEKTT